ncbi:protogenin B-like isoform X2 [Leptopilina boulardi]|uniref:protogenin B-like isoform X2 n=1 Tax=Leptopilina boulardi TaxID=63433 RepID=UPI0021F5C99D|nr:protogenin B-like isoform X2 [Leptopilina boulardi]
MAARVLLLSILFTEVLKPVYCTAIEGIDCEKIENWGLSLEIEPKGPVILGKKGTTLRCNVKSKQEITWLYNGNEAPPCGIARCSVHRNGTLHFYKKKNLDISKQKNLITNNSNSSKTSTKDEFRCVVRTNCGGYLRSSPVVVQIAKLARTFKEQPQNVKVQEGEVARLSCSIESLPFPPNIIWEHNSKPLLFDDNSEKYTFISPGVLYINATQLSDAGDYRCVATNDYLNKTTLSKEAKLIVSNSKEHSVISILPQTSYNYELIENSSLRLACAVSGYPSSVSSWSFVPRNSIIDKTQLRIHLNFTSGISILNLQNVGPSNSGVYTCAAKNSLNKTIEYQHITINVMVPPSFLKKPTEQTFPNGMRVRFECQAQGYPTPRIYWLKDAKNITINERRTIYEKGFNEMELAISNTVQSDSGVYQCVAVNEVGEISAAGRLQVNISRNNPDAPTNLKCHALSSKKILISWEPPKYLPTTNITAYTVHYSPVEGGREEVSLPENGNVTSVEVAKLLEPFTNYTFYVRLYNNHGASDQSTTITCSTAPSVPKSAPKISLNVIGDTKLNVTWKPLNKKQAQGIVTQYKLQWRLHQHPSSLVHYFNSDVEQYLLTDLNPGAQYDVRVLARTEEGWPNMNEAQFAWTTVTMPSPESEQILIRKIVNVLLTNINTSVVSMKWSINEKLNRNHGLELKLWKIYVENENGEKVETRLLPKNTTEYLFTNLEAHTSYTMGLCMLTVNEATKCLCKRIESANSFLSNIPTTLEAIPISANSINLTWNIANPYRNDIFEVCYHAVHIMKDTSNCMTINDTTALIVDLKPYTLYQFKIRVVLNDPEQTSEFSQAIECYTGEDIPGKVEDVHWFLGNSTLVRIAWKEPRKINGLVRNYYVVYTMDLSKSDTWENLTVPGNKTQTNLTGLLSGRRYFVMVQAATKAGKGKLSDPIIIVAGSSSSKIPSSSDGHRPSSKTRSDQNLGVILGLSISIVCIGLCLFSMYCRKKWETSRSLRETPQPLKNRGLVRNGNGCCIDRSSIPVNQHVSHFMGNEIELSVLCPPTTTPHLDTKGSHPNGVIELGAKEPLLHSWHTNGDSKDLHITENPQYKAKGGSASSKQQEQGLNDTQLSMVNCTLRSSANSLNNNLGGFGSEASSVKIRSNNSFPILEPNG